MNLAKFGNYVNCDGYIVSSGNSYNVNNEFNYILAELINDKDNKVIEEVEDFSKTNRFIVKECKFSGICVGITTRNVDLCCQRQNPYYGKEHFDCYTENPQKFAIVYYKDNKKRLVPLNLIRQEVVTSK